MQNMGLGDKVYSPDLQVYELEGSGGLISTVISVVSGPVRIVSRVLHNIVVMPADLKMRYAKSLLITASCFSVLGVIDLLVYSKWVLLFSQIPAFLYALRLGVVATKSTRVATQLREVDIDTEKISTLCDGVYDELDEIVKEICKDE